MASPHVQCAQAVTDYLNGQTWSLTFEAVRVWRPLHTLEQLKTLRVYVMPTTVELERTARKSIFQASYTVSIGIRQVVNAADNATIDPLDQLHDEIMDKLAEDSTPSMANCRWMSMQFEPLWNPENLNEDQLYSSVSNHIYQPEL